MKESLSFLLCKINECKRKHLQIYSIYFKTKNNLKIMNGQVNHPQHYGGENNPYEAIKVIEAWNLDFHLGNTIKYISRAGKKEDVIQDLEKAKWYLERKIEQLKLKL